MASKKILVKNSGLEGTGTRQKALGTSEAHELEAQEKDLKYLWHPYTQMMDLEKNPPLLIKKAEGIKLFTDSNFYYDTISSWWCNLHGHNHPIIIKAINEQLKKLDHTLFAGFTNEPAIELAEKLIELTKPHFKRVFYSDNGSTAVEVALKMSYQYWYNIGRREKKQFISLDNAYHGDTIGTMAVSGDSIFNSVFSDLLKPSIKVKSPYCYRCPIDKTLENCQTACIKDLEQVLQKNHTYIAGIIIEPLVLAAGGMIIYPKEYLQKVGDLCQKYQIHLILDEVAVGFGRTGKMFAFENVNIKPDFLCLSKGLTNGVLPFSATLTTEIVFQAFYADFKDKKTFYHGHTFTGNPLGAITALANLRIFEEENSLENVKKVNLTLQQRMLKFLDYPFIGDVRIIGTICAIELVKNKKTKEPFSFEERIGYKIYLEGLKHQLVLRPLGNVIYLFLPLVTTESELQIILKNLHEVVFKTFKMQ